MFNQSKRSFEDDDPATNGEIVPSFGDIFVRENIVSIAICYILYKNQVLHDHKATHCDLSKNVIT